MHNCTHSTCPGTDFWSGVEQPSHVSSGPANDPSFFPRYSTDIFTDFHVRTILAHDTSVPLFLYVGRLQEPLSPSAACPCFISLNIIVTCLHAPFCPPDSE